MLKASVEEMNRYDESPQQALALLNAKPEYGGDCKYKVNLFIGDKLIEEKHMDGNTEWHGNPLSKQVRLGFHEVEVDDDGDEEYEYNHAYFTPNDLKKIEGDGNVYVFHNDKGAKVVLTKVKEKTYSYYDAF
jgi:hypothetical protein